MKKRIKTKPRIRTKFVNGKKLHNYRVIVEQIRYQEIIVDAESQDDAESQAYDLAKKHPLSWKEEDVDIREGCTSEEMTDGSWEFCNSQSVDVHPEPSSLVKGTKDIFVYFDDVTFRTMAKHHGFLVADKDGNKYRCCYIDLIVDGRKEHILIAECGLWRSLHDWNAKAWCYLESKKVVFGDDDISFYATLGEKMYMIIKEIYGYEKEIVKCKSK